MGRRLCLASLPFPPMTVTLIAARCAIPGFLFPLAWLVPWERPSWSASLRLVRPEIRNGIVSAT
eukprot:10516182-Lingulodinium_polyedra.AAC.1